MSNTLLATAIALVAAGAVMNAAAHRKADRMELATGILFWALVVLFAAETWLALK